MRARFIKNIFGCHTQALSGALYTIFALFLVISPLLGVLHSHLEDDHQHISDSEQEAECFFCDLGISSNFDYFLALPSSEDSGAVYLHIHESNSLEFVFVYSLPRTSRAPPAV